MTRPPALCEIEDIRDVVPSTVRFESLDIGRWYLCASVEPGLATSVLRLKTSYTHCYDPKSGLIKGPVQTDLACLLVSVSIGIKITGSLSE